jgi:hypothetical protein
MRSLCLGLSLLVGAATAHANDRPRLTTARKLEIAGITLVASGYSTSATIGISETTLSTLCIACEGNMPPPRDYAPLYGLIPLAGPWIQLGRHAADFPDQRRAGASNASLAADLMPYLVPGVVELVGLTLLVVGGVSERHAAPKTNSQD